MGFSVGFVTMTLRPLLTNCISQTLRNERFNHTIAIQTDPPASSHRITSCNGWRHVNQLDKFNALTTAAPPHSQEFTGVNNFIVWSMGELARQQAADHRDGSS